jgi:phosphatidylglycerophosphate synthase
MASGGASNQSTGNRSNGTGAAWSSLPSEELRRIAQPPQYSPSRADWIYRRWSIYLSIPLAKFGLTPNGITLGWIAIGLLGAGGLVSSSWAVRVFGALLLEFSYLLDFVDGEVARLTDQRSLVGTFLDLMGHGLIKTALPFAAGASAFMQSGSRFMLFAGAVGAISIGVGDSLRFHAVCTSGRLSAGDLERFSTARRPLTELSIRELAAGTFDLSYESPGLFALVLLATLLNRLAMLTVYWMVAGPIWMGIRAIAYSRRLRALDTSTDSAPDRDRSGAGPA